MGRSSHEAVRAGSAASSLPELPDDVLALLSAMMAPQDVVRLSGTCRKLRCACSADKLWLPHFERMDCGVDFYSWRNVMDSYRALYRFMASVRSLVGLWVHQNPELGNLVFVTWGFASVVGVRIIPQEIGPQGLDTGLLWAPVFEVVGRPDGSAALFLHGRESKKDFCYPGRFFPSSSDPNVLLLEAEPLPVQRSGLAPPSSPVSSSSAELREDSTGGESIKRRLKSLKSTPKEKKMKVVSEEMSFQRLSFGDRRRVLEKIAGQVALPLIGVDTGILLPNLSRLEKTEKPHSSTPDFDIDHTQLAERRERLLRMYRFGNLKSMVREKPKVGSGFGSIASDVLLRDLCNYAEDANSNKTVPTETTSGLAKGTASLAPENVASKPVEVSRKTSLARIFLVKMRSLIKKLEEHDRAVGGANGLTSAGKSRHPHLQEFLQQSKKVGLRLQAANWDLNFYRSWPIMHTNHFALYKIPQQRPVDGREYAGLWGGTFGWPPRRPNDGKSSRALFFLLVSYDESDEGGMLIATKILEGTHYVSHPNGSAMFTAKVDEQSREVFPWETGRDGAPVNIINKVQGEGIANGYGFRYPGSKPGDLFIHSEGALSFVWRESKAVLTMERLDLQRLLEFGLRVPALPPVANFAYLTKSFSNVFTGNRVEMWTALTVGGQPIESGANSSQ